MNAINKTVDFESMTTQFPCRCATVSWYLIKKKLLTQTLRARQTATNTFLCKSEAWQNAFVSVFAPFNRKIYTSVPLRWPGLCLPLWTLPFTWLAGHASGPGTSQHEFIWSPAPPVGSPTNQRLAISLVSSSLAASLSDLLFLHRKTWSHWFD